MNCFFCKGNVINSTTTYMTSLNDCYIIIKNVPCTKCTQCGEEFLSGDVVKKIELITAKLKEMLTEVAIVDYASVA